MQVPRVYPTNNTLTTVGPGQTISQKNTTGEVISTIGQTVQNIGAAFQKVDLLTEKTKAENAYTSKMVDIESRAAQDGDTSPEKQKAYHDEINQATTDSASFIKTPSEQQQFSLELQGKSDIAKMKVNAGFQKKKIKESKDNIEIYLQQAQDNFIKSTDPKTKATAILERNNKIKDAVNANLLAPAEGQLQIAKLDKKWALAQVNYDITTNPEMARDGLKNKEYDNISEQDRVDLIKKSDLAIKQNAQAAADQIEVAQIKTQSDYLSKMASGQASWMTLSDVANDVRNGSIPEKFGTAYADVIKARAQGIQYRPKQDENRNYPDFISKIYEAKDQKELQGALYGLLLDHKNISQEKMSVLINGALERGKALSLNPAQLDSKQQEIDSAASAVVNMGRRNGMSNNEISDVYQNFNKDLASGKTPKESLDNAMKINALKKNPSLLSIPATGKMMIDQNGNRAMVFPDGHFEEIGAAPPKKVK